MKHANTKSSSLDHIQMSSIIDEPYSTTGNSDGSIVHPSDDSKVCITIPEINEEIKHLTESLMNSLQRLNRNDTT